jgi:hypothetical protein
MNSFAIVFLIVNGSALLTISRRWAALPLLIGACYMTLGQVITLGPLHLPPLRILIAIGFLRVVIRSERLAGHLKSLDWLMVAWGAWAIISSFLHKEPGDVLVNRLGLVYNGFGIYFLLRVICQSLDDVIRICRITAILLIPLSIEMFYEMKTGHNLYSSLGGVNEMSEVRDGRIRAQGPFAHSILAGTVGAVCLPLMIGLWQQQRMTSIFGTLACVLMVITSASSGPILSTCFALGALLMWYWRYRMRLFRWLIVLGYIGLDIVMKAPAYYLIARIDLTGSSTSWHRAALIEAALGHLSEWWIAGTDFTRHWLAYGVPWSENHIDITNYYLRMGVDGGLLLMFLFIAIISKGFSLVGQTLRQMDAIQSSESRFMFWALGASLFSHAASFISVSYFDQTFVFLYLTLAVICSGSFVTQLPVNKAAKSKPKSKPIYFKHKNRIPHSQILAKTDDLLVS